MSRLPLRRSIAAALALLATGCRTADPDAAPDRWPPSVDVGGAPTEPAAADGAAPASDGAAGQPAGGTAPSGTAAVAGVAATAPPAAPPDGAAGGGLVAATCEMLGTGGDLAAATGVYVGIVIPAIKGEPVGGKVMTLGDGHRRKLQGALRDLKDDDGRFCGVVDDPGGWE